MTEVSEILSLREPEGGPAPRGTLIVLGGRGEQPEVYRRFGTRLAFDAYRVHVLGDPSRDPEAARAAVAEIAGGDTPEPLVLAGSDTGALFAAGLAAEQAVPGLGGLILAGLPVAHQARPAADWEQELEARTTCPTHRGRISHAIVAPGALYGPVPDGWAQAAALELVTVPVLALHGQDDPVSPLDDAREAYAAAADLELVSVAGARHDVLNDQSHRTVAATVVLWLERLRLGAGQASIAPLEGLGAGRV
jgi:alpha-beta hydrolase superfamily lysophospholipase